jgi:hypothetical protein
MPASIGGSVREKAVSRPRAFGLLAVAIVAPLAAGACVERSSGPEQTDPAAFTWNTPISAPQTVYIRDSYGSIEVRPATDGNVRVTAEMRWHRGDPKREIKFETANGANGVTICAVWGTGTCDASHYKTGNGAGISLLGGKGSTDAKVNFIVYVPTGVKVDALTIAGSVGVAATAPVVAQSVTGSIKVATSVGPVDAETVTGDVDVRMTTLGPDGRVRAETVTGSASAYVPEKLNGALDVESSIGSISSDFASDAIKAGSKHLMATVGSGGRAVEVSTVTGVAALHKLNADGTVATP